jgi:hypothetical protein
MKNIKPSELIRLALKDLEAVEQEPETYKVCMSKWHYSTPEKCFVCLAGAVMAKSLHADPLKKADPANYSDEMCKLLYALDRFRVGDIFLGFYYMQLTLPIEMKSFHITPYDESPLEFKSDMNCFANYLQSYDL